MADRGGEWFDDEKHVFWWKRCEVPACANFICMGRSDKWCWPHLMSGGAPVTKRKKQAKPAPKRRTKETV